MSNFRHGKKRSSIYTIWRSMIDRCENPNVKAYPNYGGRGIKVCDDWHDFKTFYREMGDRPEGMTLDRIDNDKGYYKWNCKWSTRREQIINRRNTRHLTVRGITKPCTDWAQITGLDGRTILARIRKGWSEEEAVLIPKVTLRKGIPRGEQLKPAANLDALAADLRIKIDRSTT